MTIIGSGVPFLAAPAVPAATLMGAMMMGLLVITTAVIVLHRRAA